MPHNEWVEAERPAGAGSPPVHLYAASTLEGMDLPATRLIVPTLLPEGFCFLAGKPKLGKSFLALGLAVAVATGGAALGSIRVEAGDVLYIALEDTQKRLKDRLLKMMCGDHFPDRLIFANSWPRGAPGLAAIGAWLGGKPEARLVVIDTFARFRPRRESGNGYDSDVGDVEGLQELAGRHGVALLALHHARKMDADDPLDTISGTLGLSGTADGALILTRERGSADAVLRVVSRDLEDEPELGLRWDRDIASWAIAGPAATTAISPERRKILDALGGEPLGPAEVATILHKSPGSVRFLMGEMAKAGIIETTSWGRYRVVPTPGQSTNANNANNANSTNNANNANTLWGDC